jgi:hypothetical protein
MLAHLLPHADQSPAHPTSHLAQARAPGLFIVPIPILLGDLAAHRLRLDDSRASAWIFCGKSLFSPTELDHKLDTARDRVQCNLNRAGACIACAPADITSFQLMVQLCNGCGLWKPHPTIDPLCQTR